MRSSWLGTFLMLIALPVGAQSTAEHDVEFAKQLARAQTLKDTPGALSATFSVQALAPYMPREKFANHLRDASLNAANPMASFELARAAASAYLDLGRFADKGYPDFLAKHGCVRNWALVGPFANENMEAFSMPLPPELGEAGPFPGKTIEVGWRPLPAIDQGCVFTLGQVVEPSDAAVVYVSSSLAADRKIGGFLLFGANGAYRAWLNGELVAERAQDTGLSMDSEAWMVSLKPGNNTLVVKLASESSRGLGFVARVVDSNLKPLSFESSAHPNVTILKDAKVIADPRGTVAATRKMLESTQGDDAIWAAWLLKKLAWRDSATPWRDIAEREISRQGQTLSPRLLALAATLFDEAWKTQNTLEQAAQSDDPFVQAQLARLYEDSFSETQRLQARLILEKILERSPKFIVARGQLVDWYRSRSLYEKARNVLMEEPRMDVPSWIFQMVAVAQELSSGEAVTKLRGQALKISYVSSSYLWDEVRELSIAGKHEAALARVKSYREVFPTFAAKREVDLLRALGRLEEATQVWSTMITLSPGDAEYYERRSEIYMALGRLDDALQDIEFAVDRRPQDQSLREKLSFLRPAEDRYWEQFLVRDVRERAKRFEPTPFNYDTLVSQTITYVAPNGLSQQVTQRIDRVLTGEGVDTARETQVSFSMGEERVDILRVRVWKADGTISEDYSDWESGGARKASTTYNDTAYMHIRANNVGVGDVVEFQYRLSQVANSNFRGDYFGDIAYTQSSRPMAYQRYVSIYPDQWEMFFRPPALPHTREDKSTAGMTTTSFEMKNVPHVVTDADQPGATDVYDYVLVSNKQTWDDIGVWWWQLIAEQLIVDDEIRRTVQTLVMNKKTTEEKVQAIHNYVVRNTRYLHVGLGIHGWKPYRTTTAFRNRYGDCKDKAALLKVMLEEAGVEAHMVLVRTRQLGNVDSFPASMHVFNHAITYVPGLNLYLDGTAEFNGTRELTTMDQGAQALIVRDGGKTSFVTLPIDASSANVMRMKVVVDLTGKETKTTGTIHATGANAVYFRSIFEDPERRKEEFERYLAGTFPGVAVTEATFKNLEDLESPSEITFETTGGRFVFSDGNRRFVFPMGARKDLLASYAKQATRTQPLDIRVPFTAEAIVRYNIGTLKISALPPNTDLKSRFGGVSVTYETTPEGLIANVRYHIDVQRVAVEDYAEFRQFMSSINDALNHTISLAGAQ